MKNISVIIGVTHGGTGGIHLTQYYHIVYVEHKLLNQIFKKPNLNQKHQMAIAVGGIISGMFRI